ncbi:MAG TPA: hypothetical protein VL069_03790 [Opitutus sp.]|nr:hypothetical protein [Opitutus sp.]
MFTFLKNNAPPEKLYKVRITRGVTAKEWNRPVDSYAIGAEIEVLPEIASTLVDADAAVILGVVSEGVLIATPKGPQPKPTVYDRIPTPESFRELPACFSAAWQLRQDLNELKAKRDAAAERLRKAALDGGNSRGAVSAFDDADQAVKRFDYDKAERNFFESGNLALAAVRKANEAIRELDAVALSIFAQRIEALELHESHIRHLFSRSGVHRKYFLQPISESGLQLRSAFGGTYVDAPINAVATILVTARALSATCADKLKAAKAELAASTKSLKAA